MHRMGGELGFDFLVMTYCENILDDEDLDRFFANFDLKSLTFFQKELLLITFLEPNEESNARRKRVKFRNELMGLDITYFAVLEKHFVDALDDCFITGLDYELCKAYFSELHSVFKEVAKLSKYNDHVVERMGGEATFDFLVVSYCERIQGDPRMGRFFGSLTLHSLTFLQKELVLTAFLKPTDDNDADSMKSKVTLKFTPIFELGLNETHFDILSSHFSDALYDCSSKPDVIQKCQKLFDTLLPFFRENANSSREQGEEELADAISASKQKLLDEGSMRSERPMAPHGSSDIQRKGKCFTGSKSSDASLDTARTEDTSSTQDKEESERTKNHFLWRRKKSEPRVIFSWKSSGFKSRKMRGVRS